MSADRRYIRSMRASRDLGRNPDAPRTPGPWHLWPDGRSFTTCSIRVGRLGFAADDIRSPDWPEGRWCPDCLREDQGEWR